MQKRIEGKNLRWKDIWHLVWPIMISNVTVPLVGFVDVAMMGRVDNPAFIGGVGLGMIIFNAIFFSMGFLRMGTTGLVAQSQGINAKTDISRILIRGLAIAFIIGFIIVLGAPAIIFASSILFSASPQVESLMGDYARIRFLAAPPSLANMVLLGMLYGRQQMSAGMLLLLIVNIINLALDFLFVIGLGMSVSGVATASVIAQWSGFLFMIWFINHKRSSIGINYFFDKKLIISALKDHLAYRRFFILGRDIFIRTTLLILCEAVILNEAAKLGDLDLATCQLVLTLFGIIAFLLDSFAYTAEALVGEAIGKRNPNHLGIAIKRTNTLAAGLALAIAAFLWLGESVILGLLTNQETLIANTKPHWVWVCLIAPASFLAFQMDGIFVGAMRGQEMRNAMIFSALGLGIALIVLSPLSLNGLIGSFVVYLGLRGVSLWWHIDRVYAESK